MAAAPSAAKAAPEKSEEAITAAPKSLVMSRKQGRQSEESLGHVVLLSGHAHLPTSAHSGGGECSDGGEDGDHGEEAEHVGG